MIPETEAPTRRLSGFWSFYYRILFRIKRISCGRGLKVYGPLLLRIEGDPRKVVIGNNVTLLPWVDIKTRENGSIIIHDGVQLDTMARIVAANDATIELGQQAKIGPSNIINAGADVYVGRGVMIGGLVSIHSSDHHMRAGQRIAEQGYWHAPINIGADSWIGSHSVILPGVNIGEGAVVATHSVVARDVSANTIVAGIPARKTGEREQALEEVPLQR